MHGRTLPSVRRAGLGCAAVLLALASPASAAFTDAEAASVSRLVTQVVGNLSQAQSEVSFAVQGAQDPAPLLRDTAMAVKEAVREALLALALLVDVVPGSSFVAPDPAGRAGRVAEAWTHLDRIALFIDQAQAASAGAVGANTRRAKTIWLPAARSAAAGVDRAPAFADARPASWPAIIGPHGDYDRTQWRLYRSLWYLLDAVEYALPWYGAGPAADWYALLQKSYPIYDAMARGLALIAGVPPASLAGVSQFWRVLAHVASLTDIDAQAVAERLFEVGGAVAGPAELAASRVRVLDAWRHLDASVWFVLIFLDCSQASDPNGCAAGQVGSP